MLLGVVGQPPAVPRGVQRIELADRAVIGMRELHQQIRYLSEALVVIIPNSILRAGHKDFFMCWGLPLGVTVVREDDE